MTNQKDMPPTNQQQDINRKRKHEVINNNSNGGSIQIPRRSSATSQHEADVDNDMLTLSLACNGSRKRSPAPLSPPLTPSPSHLMLLPPPEEFQTTHSVVSPPPPPPHPSSSHPLLLPPPEEFQTSHSILSPPPSPPPSPSPPPPPPPAEFEITQSLLSTPPSPPPSNSFHPVLPSPLPTEFQTTHPQIIPPQPQPSTTALIPPPSTAALVTPPSTAALIEPPLPSLALEFQRTSPQFIPPLPPPPPPAALRPLRQRRNPSQAPREGKSETVPPPFPWATDKRATVQTLADLLSKQIFTISGEVACKRCERQYEMEFDLEQKFFEVGKFILDKKADMHDRAPEVWKNPILPTCRFCEQENSAKPVISTSKKAINWLFLLLGQLLGCCTLEQLRYFCKHTKNHRTGAKDRVLYLTYLSLCKQLDPNGPFDR